MRRPILPAVAWLLAALGALVVYGAARYLPVRHERAAVRTLLCELGASSLSGAAARRWVDQTAPGRGLPWLRGADLYLQTSGGGVDVGLRWRTVVPHPFGLRHELEAAFFAHVQDGRCAPFEVDG